MSDEHEFLTLPEVLQMRGSAKVCADLAMRKRDEAQRMWLEARMSYEVAVELDKAARLLTEGDGQ
jgi:hypothetical protein